jgi:DNA (cytosine-5)-methyltransferase 1
MLTIGSLFSGIGGLELGLEWAGFGPVLWQVESDPFCRRVLARHWPAAIRYEDVCAVGATELASVELLCGGFPCQDVSAAGAGAGLTGRRSGLWREFARIVGELQPEWVVVENVASGASRWLDAVVRDLEERCYEALPIPVSAAAVGAPHRRARLFVVARRIPDSDCCTIRIQQQRQAARCSTRVRDQEEAIAGDLGEAVAVVTAGSNQDSSVRPWPPAPGDWLAWRDWLAADGPEPALCRGPDGLPCGLDKSEWEARLRALGNAVVPQCAEVVGWVIRRLIVA